MPISRFEARVSGLASTMAGATAADKTFAGAIPVVYDAYLAPLLFEREESNLLGIRRVGDIDVRMPNGLKKVVKLVGGMKSIRISGDGTVTTE